MVQSTWFVQGGKWLCLGFSLPVVEGETFQTFSSPSKDPSWIWKQNAGGDIPGCSERPWRCLFLFTVTDLLLNILTMINSSLGLFLLPVSLAISFSVCLFPKEPLCCFGGKPRPRELNVLSGSRGGEQSSSLPALQLGWDPNRSRAGGRDADKELQNRPSY